MFATNGYSLIIEIIWGATLNSFNELDIKGKKKCLWSWNYTILRPFQNFRMQACASCAYLVIRVH